VTVRWYSMVVDATDPTRLASFWAQALGWSIACQEADEIAIEAPDDPGDHVPAIVFVRVAGSKTRKIGCTSTSIRTTRQLRLSDLRRSARHPSTSDSATSAGWC
jgi:hypothetical protein